MTLNRACWRLDVAPPGTAEIFLRCIKFSCQNAKPAKSLDHSSPLRLCAFAGKCVSLAPGQSPMSKLFSRSFVISIVALLMVVSMAHTRAQTPNVTLTDRDEADILESLIQLANTTFGSEFITTRNFASENISSLSASRLKQLGFTLVPPEAIELRKRDSLIDYVVIRSISIKDGIVVVRMSAVHEGRPCFAAAFSTQKNFTYYFKKDEEKWVGRLVRGPSPFIFSKRLTTP